MAWLCTVVRPQFIIIYGWPWPTSQGNMVIKKKAFSVITEECFEQMRWNLVAFCILVGPSLTVNLGGLDLFPKVPELFLWNWVQCQITPEELDGDLKKLCRIMYHSKASHAIEHGLPWLYSKGHI